MMRTTHLGAGLMAAIFTLGCVATTQAEVTDSQTTTTTTTNIYPSSTMSAPVVAKPMTGAVQTTTYDKKVMGIKTGNNIAKTIVLQPGYGQVSLDGLGWKKNVNLTLVNPSATPLQFETTQNKTNKGKVMSAQVPAHSQTQIAYKQTFSGRKDPVKFYVMQQPDNAISTNQDYVTQQTAAVATVQSTAMREDMERQTAQIQSAQEQAMRAAMLMNQRGTERSSAVRGYW